jgi:hypothetical protein
MGYYTPMQPIYFDGRLQPNICAGPIKSESPSEPTVEPPKTPEASFSALQVESPPLPTPPPQQVLQNLANNLRTPSRPSKTETAPAANRTPSSKVSSPLSKVSVTREVKTLVEAKKVPKPAKTPQVSTPDVAASKPSLKTPTPAPKTPKAITSTTTADAPAQKPQTVLLSAEVTTFNIDDCIERMNKMLNEVRKNNKFVESFNWTVETSGVKIDGAEVELPPSPDPHGFNQGLLVAEIPGVQGKGMPQGIQTVRGGASPIPGWEEAAMQPPSTPRRPLVAKITPMAEIVLGPSPSNPASTEQAHIAEAEPTRTRAPLRDSVRRQTNDPATPRPANLRSSIRPGSVPRAASASQKSPPPLPHTIRPRPSESFLERMMRPTASSAQKVHQKLEIISPPRRR